MFIRSKIATILTSIIVVSSISIALPAQAKTTATCTLINKYYPAGVAVSKWSKNQGEPIEEPRVRSSVYKKYSYLDYDKDGIICEVPSNDTDSFWGSLEDINSMANKMNKISSETNIRISPNISNAKGTEYSSMIHMSTNFWSQYNDMGNTHVILWTADDLSWAKSEYRSITSGWNLNVNDLDNDVRNGQCVRSIANTRFAKPNSTEFEVNTVVRLCINSWTMSAWEWHTFAHEITHMFQQPATLGNAPMWVLEGMGTYYGIALGSMDRPGAIKNIDMMYSNWSKYDSYGKYAMRAIKKNPSKLVTVIEKMSDPKAAWNPSLTGAAYNIGSVFTGMLVKEYGHDKVVEYMKSFANSKDYKANFELVFGIDLKSFCDKIAVSLVQEMF